MQRTRRQAGGFQPPHCPNPACRFHRPHPDWRFIKRGGHRSPRDGRRVQDYRCKTYRRSFSARTFSVRYWLKRPDLLIPVAQLITEGACIRQAARTLGASPATVSRLIARLGRHCLLAHVRLCGQKPITEPLVIDGFETFEYSQFFPFHLNLAVGARSWFLYHFTDSPLRRKGSMTAGQKRKRANAPPAYRRALVRLRREGYRALCIRHRITSSQERRTQSNPLFPVNLADLLLRHGSANHRREKAPAPAETAAMAAGILDRPLTWREILKKRLFPAPIALPPEWAVYYAGRVKTLILGERQAAHRLRYAY